MNKIIIDGYNMIHRVPKLNQFLEKSLERARHELILLLKSYLVRAKVQIILVFDGQYSFLGTFEDNPNSKLEVIFSKHPMKADPLIKAMIDKEKNKKTLTLVSDDVDIVNHARGQGTQVLSPVDFYHRIEKRIYKNELHNKYDINLTEEEIAEWLEIFGAK